MMNEHFYAVILAGGKGERFWPLSTGRTPKQLLSLVGGKPLLTLAFERLKGLIPPSRVFVVTNKALVAATRKVAPRMPAANIIGEPFGRDSAAAIAVGAALVKKRDPNGVFCVLTADHIMGNIPLFRKTLTQCLDLASHEPVLITIGIKPRSPNTGYGYIEAEARRRKIGGITFCRARRFVEKPDLKKAVRYVESGNYYWNSGMFVWSVRTIENELRTHRPPLADLIRKAASVRGRAALENALERAYKPLEKISIDFALMEKARHIVMARGVFPWDDVGSWTALEDHIPKDSEGNVLVGLCESVNSRDNIVLSNNHLTTLVGVRDLIVVQAPGVTMICPKDRAQDVKKLVEKLKSSGRYSEVL
jgi:mannose-1-phosphate guanylyltransferase